MKDRLVPEEFHLCLKRINCLPHCRVCWCISDVVLVISLLILFTFVLWYIVLHLTIIILISTFGLLTVEMVTHEMNVGYGSGPGSPLHYHGHMGQTQINQAHVSLHYRTVIIHQPCQHILLSE